jgi:hypothetical protein
LKILTDLISSFDPSSPNFRPTELYNESWLVKLVLDQASKISSSELPIGFLSGSTWFSEALLPSAFEARFRGDPLSESRTNADGVIGHIAIGKEAKADLELARDATQFTVVEAKIGSPLSPGTSNAKYFDQAARNVACMAEVLARSDAEATNLERLNFVVLAPQYSVDKGTFAEEMKPISIKAKVDMRVSEYDGDLDQWFEDHFTPTMNRVELFTISWEETIQWIGEHSSKATDELAEYYKQCLDFA